MANLLAIASGITSASSPEILLVYPLSVVSYGTTYGGAAEIIGLTSLVANCEGITQGAIADIELFEALTAVASCDTSANSPDIILIYPLTAIAEGATSAGTPTISLVYVPDYDSWNVVALIEKTRLNLGDPNGERWATARVLEALNDCMMDVVLYVQLITETIHFDLTADQALYDMRTLAQAYSTNPREYALPLRLSHLTALPTGKTLPTDLAELARSIIALRPTTRLVGDFTHNTGGKVGNHLWAVDKSTYGYLEMIPAPTATQGYGILDYAAYPTAMTADSDYPDTLQSFLRGVLATGAAARLLDEGDTDDVVHAARLDAEFQSGLRTIRSEIGHTTTYQSVRPM